MTSCFQFVRDLGSCCARVDLKQAGDSGLRIKGLLDAGILFRVPPWKFYLGTTASLLHSLARVCWRNLSRSCFSPGLIGFLGTVQHMGRNQRRRASEANLLKSKATILLRVEYLAV
jgi:hypothetical protein